MKSNVKTDMISRFSLLLIKKLRDKYGQTPSAHWTANQFNLRARHSQPITPETARRWMRGLSLPQIDRFETLKEWLDIKATDFLLTDQECLAAGTDHSDQKSMNLVAIFEKLNFSDQHAIIFAAQTLLEARYK